MKRKPPARKAATPAARRTTAIVRAPAAAPVAALRPSELLAAREMYWHNVIREILTSLAAICAKRPEPGAEPPPPQPGDTTPAYDPDLFDGRMAIVNQSGERVAIADVVPLFACGQRHHGELAHAVECTVFQIRTPGGEVYTLPLHEIRSFHALTPELMARLERAQRRRRPPEDSEEQQHPFGFAAYTSLVRGLPDAVGPAPEHPTE